ncbi:putative transcription regulator with HTH domain protein [Chondrocystis sp. NIES-4102]|nr:putative transcription regulator with HTH domain protein [Chondrocystis sp. NIES-4102]
MLNTTATNGKMTPTINLQKYFRLLDELQLIPKIIENEAEYEQYLAISENLIAKKDDRTTEETALFRLLVKLIEDYEEQTFALKQWQNIPPHFILQHLLESSGTKQSDLVGIVSPSKGLISSIVNGKRAISKQQAKKLGVFFKVSPSLFI